jgi:hypothetical protein
MNEKHILALSKNKWFIVNADTLEVEDTTDAYIPDLNFRKYDNQRALMVNFSTRNQAYVSLFNYADNEYRSESIAIQYNKDNNFSLFYCAVAYGDELICFDTQSRLQVVHIPTMTQVKEIDGYFDSRLLAISKQTGSRQW